MRAAPGAGVVSSFVMQSDDLDELDWEFIGSDAAQAQTNYFGKGNTTTYDRGASHPVSTPQDTYHTYAINWTSTTTTWFINGAPVRTLNFADAAGGKNYRQTPMNIRIGNWIAGTPGNAEGTIQWARGLTDFSKAPFNMYVQSVKVINHNPGASYKYGDQSGNWQSIQVSGALPQELTPVATLPASNSTDGPGGQPYRNNSTTGGSAGGSLGGSTGGSTGGSFGSSSSGSAGSIVLPSAVPTGSIGGEAGAGGIAGSVIASGVGATGSAYAPEATSAPAAYQPGDNASGGVGSGAGGDVATGGDVGTTGSMTTAYIPTGTEAPEAGVGLGGEAGYPDASSTGLPLSPDASAFPVPGAPYSLPNSTTGGGYSTNSSDPEQFTGAGVKSTGGYSMGAMALALFFGVMLL
ncbi:hypothetical protein LTS18_011653 [Coniosporium uncinatum]|uniref:Uncharacterized protein n=1 Tax=Coniosporium uncinatum TaxID=93489 RepID=A0ACC3DZA9_9PEZI|nr:hypothetical protein LTS18_011653 [Coniosporium uncinatum]